MASRGIEALFLDDAMTDEVLYERLVVDLRSIAQRLRGELAALHERCAAHEAKLAMQFPQGGPHADLIATAIDRAVCSDRGKVLRLGSLWPTTQRRRKQGVYEYEIGWHPTHHAWYGIEMPQDDYPYDPDHFASPGTLTLNPTRQATLREAVTLGFSEVVRILTLDE